MVFFLSHRSTKVPAIGITIKFGMKEIAAAIDKNTALSVISVIHHIMLKNTIELPKIEHNCPLQKIKYLLRDFVQKYAGFSFKFPICWRAEESTGKISFKVSCNYTRNLGKEI